MKQVCIITKAILFSFARTRKSFLREQTYLSLSHPDYYECKEQN